MGKAPSLKVGDQLAGRFFNAYGEPIDGGPIPEGREVEIGGPSVNPVRRKQPSELIATGIAGIDLNNTLVTGQKIPFFADPDQPFNQVMAMVALRAKSDKIILGGMGMTNDDYLFFKNTFSNAGALDRIVSFINTTEDPSVERILIPDMALSAAEYFAVEKNEKVLVLLTDMTNYADAWRSYQTVWTRSRLRTLCRVPCIRIWRRFTKRRCNSLPVLYHDYCGDKRCPVEISRTLCLIIRVILRKDSYSCVVIAISVRLLLTRSVHCPV